MCAARGRPEGALAPRGCVGGEARSGAASVHNRVRELPFFLYVSYVPSVGSSNGSGFQHFSENPYFTDKVVKKVYKYVAPPAAKDEKPDEDGITQSMIEFDWERDIESQVRVFFFLYASAMYGRSFDISSLIHLGWLSD